jgi:hypothetical protein
MPVNRTILFTHQALHVVLVSILLRIINGYKVAIYFFVDLLTEAEPVHHIHDQVRLLFLIVVLVRLQLLAVRIQDADCEPLLLII